MKRILLYCTLSVMLFACHKDNKQTNPPPKTDGKTYTIQFNVSAGGTSTLNSIKQTNSIKQPDIITPVSQFANTLEYWVYNSDGKLITRIFQTSATSNFGEITDTFSAGTYSIVIIAQNDPSDSPKQIGAPANYSTGTIQTNGKDTFFKTFSLTVSDSTVNQDITLARIVGQLQVIITDAIPANTLAIGSSVISDRYISISTGLPTATTYPINVGIVVPPFTIGQTNYTMTGYVANTVAPFTVYISALNTSGVVFASDSVKNITCQANTRTTLSGNLFSTAYPNVGFTVSFNDTWDGDPVTIPFNSRNPAPTTRRN